HDDVGGRLPTLIHTAPDNHYEGLARTAMEALRESIHALDDKRRFYLEDLLDGWQEDARLRMLPTGVKMDWQSLPDDAQQIAMTPRYYINLRRVLDEALTNALKHGSPSRLIFNAALENHQLRLRLSNTLPETNDSHWHDGLHGRGLSNMQTRMQELGGELSLYCLAGKPRQFFLEVKLETHLLKTTSVSQ
ncbi:sensor histidine kinase, partial [Pseudoalteromonas sp. GABNS16H]|uniref:sensor histidine kinase n=1 Tax=Pseudoalteromonas sp. GABNS16H TaxID=3025325 RepID=UPI0023626115